MNTIFRTDASLEIGTGHVMRCLALADALREKGTNCRFVCRAHPGNLLDQIRQRGFETYVLPAQQLSYGPLAIGEGLAERKPAHAAWLGTDWATDAALTKAIIGETAIDLLIVDHYALDARWEQQLRPSCRRLFVIDDLADRPHDCDLLLDQNLVAQMQTRYADKVPAACGMLLGPDHALLQPIYADVHERIPPREGQIQRILIYFGGADNDNLTGRTLAAFLQLNRPDIEVDVVITAGSPHAAALRQQVVGCGNIHLCSGLPTLAPLMARADLAIGASGATSWERLCLGLPALVVTLATNQRPIADELSQRGLIRWLGHQDAVDQATIAQALGQLLRHGLDEDWSLRCLAAVDGKGVDRVCAALTVMATTPLRVRRARLGDEALLLEWANDPTTRRNAFSPAPISAATHQIWFQSRLRNQDGCRLYIVETTDGVPLGHVRFERSEQAWEVHYALAPIFRGRGLGLPILDAAMLQLRTENMQGGLVFGQVKVGNYSSRKIFESLGFEFQLNAGVAVYQRAL